MAVTVGIDPGKAGALAVIGRDGALIDVADMPVTVEVSAALLHELLVEWDRTLDGIGTVVVEEVAAFPKNGSVGNFKLGMAFGTVLGACTRWPIQRVRPAVWKKALGLSSDKELSRRRAIELWPDMAGQFARKRDDGRAEAALIAHWYQRHGGTK